MKALTWVFGVCVAGIVFSFGMSVYTAVQQDKAESQVQPISIPLPARAN
jgi:hypothetical protein